ncbi:SEL1-like repeat protein [Pyruvatibacter sp.]|uniref:tetratricopeptide repeat protein n=1 Tax=Pyruvatibacter sp. TaxID=1981328 RepID=UPI0032648CA7
MSRPQSFLLVFAIVSSTFAAPAGSFAQNIEGADGTPEASPTEAVTTDTAPALSNGSSTNDTSTAANEVLAKQFRQGVSAYDAKKYGRAFELWLPLAQNGDLAAQRNVAHLLRRGLGVAQDLPRARKFYEQSAEFGFVTAQTNLAVMLLEGEGGEPEPEEAAYWLDRAARGGHPIAQFHLARLYETGTGVEPNPGRALGWYALASRSGHQPSLDRLAELVMILPGPSSDTEPPRDITDAPSSNLDETATAEALEEPDPSVKASELPAEQSPAPEASLETIEPEASTQTAEDVAPSELEEALSAYSSRRYQDAQLQFEALAYRGNSEAQYRLGRMRNRGEGEPRDPVAALAWWTVAAETGHAKSEKAASDLHRELGPRRRAEAEREAAQFKALISQLTSSN